MQVEKSENAIKYCSKRRPNLSILKTKQSQTSFSAHNSCKEDKVEKEEEDKVGKEEDKVEKEDEKEEDKVETVDEFLDNAYKNLLNSTTPYTSSGFVFVYDSDTDEEFEEFYAAFASDQVPIDDENDEINHQTVEEFLESAYNNLLNYFNNKDDCVEEPKGDLIIHDIYIYIYQCNIATI